jgi:hypothetical protein
VEDSSETLNRDDILVRFMGEHTVTIPLWGGGGLMFSGPEQLIEAGIDPGLVAELVRWSADWNHGKTPELHLRAIELIEKLRVAFERRYIFVYQP